MIILGDLESELKKEISKIDNDFEGIVINVGDSQIINHDNKKEREFLDWLNQSKYMILFLDGNHDNVKILNAMPITEMFGGKVHKIRDKVIHLIRGEIYNIEGKKIFVFGGGQTHNIEQGYVDFEKGNVKEQFLDLIAKGRSKFRIKDINWWEEEMPTKEEMDKGWGKLKEHNFEVDYILTHTAPSEILKRICNSGGVAGENVSGDRPDISEFTDYLQKIYTNVKFNKWLCGHLHKSYTNGKITVLNKGEIDIE